MLVDRVRPRDIADHDYRVVLPDPHSRRAFGRDAALVGRWKLPVQMTAVRQDLTDALNPGRELMMLADPHVTIEP